MQNRDEYTVGIEGHDHGERHIQPDSRVANQFDASGEKEFAVDMACLLLVLMIGTQSKANPTQISWRFSCFRFCSLHGKADLG